MAKKTYTKLKGMQNLRLRLLLSTLSRTPIIIDEIRADDTFPGLRAHEVSLLRLVEKICDDCVVEINETGTRLKYRPGIVMGGKHLVHDCGLSRSIGYFLEPLIVLGLFGKNNLSIRLKGITNDSKDPCVDTFQSTTLPLLKRFGASAEIKIDTRGCPPLGGGEIVLTVPIIHQGLAAVSLTDEGMVKRIRGVSFSTKVSPELQNTMIYAARGIFNLLLPDVHIFTDHRKGREAGNSPGYGMSVVAETTSGCCISVDTSVHGEREDEIDGDGEDENEKKKKLKPPEVIGEELACLLLGEIEQGGVVDSSHQGLLFVLCALCVPDVSKVRVGKLTPYGIEALRHINDFLRVKFVINPDPFTETLVLKCVGCGLNNLSRKVS